MNKYDSSIPFQSIADAARTTGLSRYHIRNGCKDGTIPHIKVGDRYKVNVPLLLKQLDAQSAAQGA